MYLKPNNDKQNYSTQCFPYGIDFRWAIHGQTIALVKWWGFAGMVYTRVDFLKTDGICVRCFVKDVCEKWNSLLIYQILPIQIISPSILSYNLQCSFYKRFHLKWPYFLNHPHARRGGVRERARPLPNLNKFSLLKIEHMFLWCHGLSCSPVSRQNNIKDQK